jgi:hemolysin activation/secretion protein
MSYDHGTPKTLYGPFSPLDITGISDRYRPGFRQILLNTQKRKIDAVVTVEQYDSKTWFDGILNYRERTTGITTGFDFVHRGEKSARFSSLYWVFGNAGTIGNPDFDGGFVYDDFHLLKGSMMQVLNPNKVWTLIGRANAQWALSSLPQSQVFQIGGMATVRGTSEALMSAESGYLLSLEARRFLTETRHKGRLEAFCFFDHGGVFYRQHAPQLVPSDYLFTVGTGLIFNMSKNLSTTVGYGQPLFTAESHQSAFREDLKHGRGYFTVRAMF